MTDDKKQQLLQFSIGHNTPLLDHPHITLHCWIIHKHFTQVKKILDVRKLEEFTES